MNTLRHAMCSKRLKLPKEVVSQASQVICNTIAATTAFMTSTHLALYLPIENEIDLQPLLLQAVDKNYYLPITQTHKLSFVKYKIGDPLVLDKYGIPAPVFNPHNCIAPIDLDLVITPLVAFDSSGNRLGRGKGYYDKTFAHKLTNPANKPILLGVAYEFQKTLLSPQPWDVPLQIIITEETCYNFF